MSFRYIPLVSGSDEPKIIWRNRRNVGIKKLKRGRKKFPFLFSLRFVLPPSDQKMSRKDHIDVLKELRDYQQNLTSTLSSTSTSLSKLENKSSSLPSSSKEGFKPCHVVWLTEGDETYFSIAASLSDAEDQYNILQDLIHEQSAKKLYDTVFSNVRVRTESDPKAEPSGTSSSSSSFSKKRKKGSRHWSLDPRSHRKYTIAEFLSVYRSKHIKAEDETILFGHVSIPGVTAQLPIGRHMSAEAMFEGVCHSKDYLDESVPSLDAWHQYNPPSMKANFTTLKRADRIVNSIEEFKERSVKRFN